MAREKGISIAGPDIKSLIKEISTQSLKAAIQKNLHYYWETNLINFSKFKRSDCQAIISGNEYVSNEFYF